ncbi:transporter substrate-binding domain-containing protein [Paenibacillus alvei]|uniref:Transporter substrate-binding domain-containing protein n=2 Tax=Paenibacillus TaxID=44249 RepID=A0ABT4GTT9_PAEAL|nr:transporter substrate-binding domain-containing protein [Paenibacillus alvei]EJW17817.1 cystine-binding periplasmic protein FliY [Paenibacillus alvei DSM 29]MCY9543334.1 transporter substrate-binding domain-containing protein [Paenibacillus alvei]MCY9706714.1 transporter substrate-binding domain-containing protein [Paenibacillus alvei]MCY9736412.1 transporter substrate-binding domain-containing protein [Paenibacillus alvei]MCY9756906.1 transporter substrate-binding domain-containing protein
MSFHFKKLLKATTLLTVLAVALVGCGSKSTTDAGSANALEQIKKSGKIKIGLMGTYAPYNFINDKREVDGFDADIAKAVAKHIGVEVEFITGEFSGLIEGLQKDKYDALVSQVTITDDRKQKMDFSTPYVKNAVNVIVKSDNTSIQKIEDFKDKKIGVGLGTNDEKYLRDVAMPKVGKFEIATYNDVITSLQDLNVGRIDATINNVFALKPLIEKNHFDVKAVGEPIKEDVAGIAIRKNNPELLAAINKALEEMKSDGTFKEIFKKWFDVEPNI